MLSEINWNTDAELTSLAMEINDLDKQGKNMTIQIAQKVIRARELLRQKNGYASNHKLDSLGLRSPAGWEQWCKENLKISSSYAATCVRRFINPEKERTYKFNHKSGPRYALTRTTAVWKTWTTEQREEFSIGFLKLLDMP